MWLDVIGEAETAEDAAAVFSNAGRDVAAFISLITNAAVAPVEPELVYEVTPGVTRRSFFQRFVPADAVTLSSRFIDLETIGPLVEGLLKLPDKDRDRLARTISQYSEALRYWRMGNEVLVISHLWMAVEALKRACWRQELARLSITQQQLAAEWGYDPSGSLREKEFLDRVARKRLIFQDDPIHAVAKNVSDAFEHGFQNAGTLYVPAREAMLPTARFVRRAVLNILERSTENHAGLTQDKYERPRGPDELELYWRTTLCGEAEHLGLPGDEYPMYQCEFGLEKVSFNAETDKFEFTPKMSMTALIAKGLTFEGGSFEVWDAGYFAPGEPSKVPEPTPAQAQIIPPKPKATGVPYLWNRLLEGFAMWLMRFRIGT
jgi:hypothetical protein